MSKFKKGFWVTVGIGSVFFIVMIILSAVLNLGDRLSQVHPYVAYAFYGFAGILFILLFVKPMCDVIFSKTFSMDSLFDEEENARRNYVMYRKVAKNIVEQPYLSEDEKHSIESSLSSPIELKKSLSIVFDHTIKKEINKIIVKHAESVFLSTAISQNGQLDSLAVITINLRLIRELVMECGFRPSYASLGRLSFNVLTSALIAEGLEEADLESLISFPGSTVLQGVLKTVTGSFMQGVGNALLSLRVGIITRNYLFMNLKGMTKKEIRNMAFLEAVKLLPNVLTESVKKLPSRLKTLFDKVF